jgi:phosphotransferase system enzyme I (PtsI)
MERLQGIAVSPGVAIGEVLVMDNEGFRIPRRFLPRDAVEDELERLNRAIAAATDEIERKRAKVSEQLGKNTRPFSRPTARFSTIRACAPSWRK